MIVVLIDSNALSILLSSIIISAFEFRQKVSYFVLFLIAHKIVKQKPVVDENSKKCWTNNYSTRKNIKQIKTSIIKMEHYKIFKLLNDSIVSTFVTKNRSK